METLTFFSGNKCFILYWDKVSFVFLFGSLPTNRLTNCQSDHHQGLSEGQVRSQVLTHRSWRSRGWFYRGKPPRPGADPPEVSAWWRLSCGGAASLSSASTGRTLEVKKEGNRVTKHRAEHTNSLQSHRSELRESNRSPEVETARGTPSRARAERRGSFVRLGDNLPTWKWAVHCLRAHTHRFTPQPW